MSVEAVEAGAPLEQASEQVVGSDQGEAWQSRIRGRSGDGTAPKRKVRCADTARTLTDSRLHVQFQALEVTDGQSVRHAGDALCWAAVTGKPCECDGKKLHLAGDCPASVQHLLGQRRGPCNTADCSEAHPEAAAFRERVLGWWGSEWHWVTAKEQQKKQQKQHQPLLCVPVPSLAGSSGEGARGEGGVCLFQTAEFWQNEVQTKFPLNRYLHQLTREAWFGTMLSTPGAEHLWRGNRRTLLKELSESCAVVERVKEQLGSGSDGSDALLFDVCSGKGIASLMMCFALPGSRVVMVDSDTRMGLQHLVGPMQAGQLQFYNMDIFTPKLPQLLKQHTSSSRITILIGTHLCGSLSPRLISVFRDCAEVDWLLLAPCCLKGWLGKQVQKRAKELGRQHYSVLCEELGGMVGSESTIVHYDDQVLSPKNGYIMCSKPKNPPAALASTS